MQTYKMGIVDTSTTRKEWGLEVKLNTNFKLSEQFQIAGLKANRRLVLIRRNIIDKEEEIITSLYKAIIRALLENCIQIGDHPTTTNSYIRENSEKDH